MHSNDIIYRSVARAVPLISPAMLFAISGAKAMMKGHYVMTFFVWLYNMDAMAIVGLRLFFALRGGMLITSVLSGSGVKKV
jgi:hypothetical protein